MVIVHKQVGDMSLTEVDFGDHMPSDEEVRRVREILGLGSLESPNPVDEGAPDTQE